MGSFVQYNMHKLSITMLSNQCQYLSDVIEQWSCVVASLQQVHVAGKMFMCVLLHET